jgi:hypothetical protein
LFALQLEIEQIDPAHLAQASSERVRHYSRVLSAQLQELLDELEWREEEFCLAFGIEPWLRVKPNKLPALLNEQVNELQFLLMQTQSDLQQLNVRANVKRLLEQLRKLQERNEVGDFLLPFEMHTRARLAKRALANSNKAARSVSSGLAAAGTSWRSFASRLLAKMSSCCGNGFTRRVSACRNDRGAACRIATS